MALQSKLDPDVDARWAAWVARGAAHDRALRRRLAIIVPAAVLVAADICVLLLR